MIQRVLVTPEAEATIDQLREKNGPLIFHQSGGCCDGSSPMCFVSGEMMLDDNDVWIGDIHGCPFLMSNDQFEYWKHTQLIVGITKGRGSSFSLEIPMSTRFIIRSRLFTDEELAQLQPVRKGSEVA